MNRIPIYLLSFIATFISFYTVANPLQPVITEPVHRQDGYEVFRVFAGRVLGSQRADIGFEQAGVVQQVLVDDGQAVKAGELLAKLDRRSLNIERDQLKARQQELNARLSQLQRDVVRYKALREKSYVSEGQLEELETQVTASQAQSAQIDAQLKAINLQLEKTELKAPFNGEVAKVQVEEGVVVGQGQVVMQLVETGESEAVFGISDRLGRDLVMGQSMQVSGDFGDIDTNLIAVASNLDWRSQTRTIRVALPENTSAVDGNTAYIHLPQHREVTGFWMPAQALLEDVRGTWAVYGLQKNAEGYQVQKHSVEALYHHRGRVYLSGELVDGSLVVTEGVHRLAPGQAVVLAGQVNADDVEGKPTVGNVHEVNASEVNAPAINAAGGGDASRAE
jgi:RND family efflux transporter MFP subunit